MAKDLRGGGRVDNRTVGLKSGLRRRLAGCLPLRAKNNQNDERSDIADISISTNLAHMDVGNCNQPPLVLFWDWGVFALE